MSCTCNDVKPVSDLPCPCDEWNHPAILNIPPGQDQLNRQIAVFASYRKAMLAAVRRKAPLLGFKGKKADDPGMMLLEMWAYVCDVLSLYDKAIAQESYMRTAQQPGTVRKLAGLLGYLPRPAISSQVWVTALAEGRTVIKVPEGAAFSTSAFEGSSPQQFEALEEQEIHPLLNSWQISLFHPPSWKSGNPYRLLLKNTGSLAADSILLLQHLGQPGITQALKLKNTEPFADRDGKKYTALTLSTMLKIPDGSLLKDLVLQRPNQSAKLWSASDEKAIMDDTSSSMIVLNQTVTGIRAGSWILVEGPYVFKACQVTAVEEIARYPKSKSTININGTQFEMPSVPQQVTQLTLDRPVRDIGIMAMATGVKKLFAFMPEWLIHYDWNNIGEIIQEIDDNCPDDMLLPLYPAGDLPEEKYLPSKFSLTDKNQRGLQVGGSLMQAPFRLQINPGTGWKPALQLPVTVNGNHILLTRGETVSREILGSGDATAINQVFKLQKKPLSYRYSGNLRPEPYLTVYVNGIAWKMVDSFYNRKPEERVYIVRQDDEGSSLVIFGDGLRGSRLVSGESNIVATYRFGAEGTQAPAQTVNQLLSLVKGLESINNPTPAFGGEDAEKWEDTRRNAPPTAVLLGRAVSLPDMEVVARGYAGVKGAQAAWRWNSTQQTPLVHIFYIGEEGFEASLSAQIRNLTDPSLMLVVERALPVKVNLQLDLEFDPLYNQKEVLTAVRQNLTTPETGLLATGFLPIGKPFFRSWLFAAILKVEGVRSVRSVTWNGSDWEDYAQVPGEGKYFDFSSQKPGINGQ